MVKFPEKDDMTTGIKTTTTEATKKKKKKKKKKGGNNGGDEGGGGEGGGGGSDALKYPPPTALPTDRRFSFTGVQNAAAVAAAVAAATSPSPAAAAKELARLQGAGKRKNKVGRQLQRAARRRTLISSVFQCTSVHM